MKQLWFVIGSQHLYGDETIRQVADHAAEMAEYFNEKLPYEVILKPIATTSDIITSIMKEANASDDCIGIITWMHTFSPSKMWITGLNIIEKPILHLHTQYNEKIPYDSIDMDFMNLNQSAHGDREHGFIYARMRKNRKVVAGYWKDEETLSQIEIWAKAAYGYHISRNLRVCRFGDNMRDVAVTDGNRVSAEVKFGWSVNYYAVGDLVDEISKVTDDEIDALMEEYSAKYTIVTDKIDSIREQAKYEIALKRFMERGNFGAYTNTFEDLHGMKQLPGLASQRMMEHGYGFGAEGDWKTAAMLRIMKAMAGGEKTAFMEDYTYHLEKGNEMILGAHMLEVCPTIAKGDIKIDVQPLGIGGKEPPARMIFDGEQGEAIAVSLVDLGNRYRLIVAEVNCVDIPEKMPKLPVAGVMWKPYPNFHDGVKAWLLAGGAHHTVLSFALTKEHMIDFARMYGIECVVIGKNTDVDSLEKEIYLTDLIMKD
ncbi:MAG: L-arabinose isomerase [Clostridia bacterium]|nr:L-arabinose isomerase [Clostridia bacterium]